VNLRLASSEDSGPTYGLAETVGRLQALIGVESISADYVRLCIAVTTAQATARGALAECDLVDLVSPARGPKSGPLLQVGAIRWNTGVLASLLDDLCAALATSERAGDALGRLRSACDENVALLAELAETAAFRPKESHMAALAEQTDTPPEVLALIGRMLAAPFVVEAAERFRCSGAGGPGAGDSSGHCPMCGSAPAIAWLRRDGGQRVLYCSLCEQRWPFARLQCPFCGNRDQHTLGFLAIAGDEVHSAETCGKCRRYIKTVDEDKLAAGEEVIPLVEDAATLHMDLVAERDGYVRSFI
jgi:formate dehydrogenase accessory protein FdhE